MRLHEVGLGLFVGSDLESAGEGVRGQNEGHGIERRAAADLKPTSSASGRTNRMMTTPAVNATEYPIVAR